MRSATGSAAIRRSASSSPVKGRRSGAVAVRAMPVGYPRDGRRRVLCRAPRASEHGRRRTRERRDRFRAGRRARRRMVAAAGPDGLQVVPGVAARRRHGDVHARALGRAAATAACLRRRPGRPGCWSSAATCAWRSGCALCWGSERCASASLARARPCCSRAARARPTSTGPCRPRTGRRASSRSPSTPPGTLLLGTPARRLPLERRRPDVAHDDPPRLGRALGRLHAGLDDRLARAAAAARQSLLRPRRPAQALALPRRQRARALVAARREALRARPRHVLAPLRHARLRAHVVPAPGAEDAAHDAR